MVFVDFWTIFFEFLWMGSVRWSDHDKNGFGSMVFNPFVGVG